MRPTTRENMTVPGSDAFDEKLLDSAPEGACVYCGDYDPDFREHFMTHFAANGGEYGRYAAAYEMGHRYSHDNQATNWDDAEPGLRAQWERRAQGPWEDFKEAIRYGWKRHGGKK